jgi:Ca-activated chloride channel family protein
MEWKNPLLFIFIFIVPILIFLYKKYLYKTPSIKYSSIKIIESIPPSSFIYGLKMITILRYLAIILLIIAMARPRKGIEGMQTPAKVTDIILTLDVSGSMDARDFNINLNRLDHVKKAVKRFVGLRPVDRLGIVIYATGAYLQCPLTLDHGILINLLENIKVGMIEYNTAIGSAIMESLSRLETSKAKSKVIILLTDGVNNAGEINPITAAKAAKTLGVKIYTIGVGKKGIAHIPIRDHNGDIIKRYGKIIFDRRQVIIDEKLLKEIADITGGEYNRAANKNALKEIYDKINRMEKTEVKGIRYFRYKEYFNIFAILALILIVLELILRRTALRVIP